MYGYVDSVKKKKKFNKVIILLLNIWRILFNNTIQSKI